MSLSLSLARSGYICVLLLLRLVGSSWTRALESDFFKYRLELVALAGYLRIGRYVVPSSESARPRTSRRKPSKAVESRREPSKAVEQAAKRLPPATFRSSSRLSIQPQSATAATINCDSTKTRAQSNRKIKFTRCTYLVTSSNERLARRLISIGNESNIE